MSLLRLLPPPLLALGTADLLGFTGLPRDMMLFGNGMPVAVAMPVLSERR